jgi:carbonic anhydrase/acetyltransferase-like protein (isoleucine patch superfamily)
VVAIGRNCIIGYISRIFQNARIERPSETYDESLLSDKVRQVINLLIRYEGNARGIIFVKERATTFILIRVLKSRFAITVEESCCLRRCSCFRNARFSGPNTPIVGSMCR